ncbi:ninein-like protein [Gadus chalcogrammus]|uniref:ninein-like protein n=1 Tax=Gadus chalcogrammus TaxID=1042646 RepID=UPI0024C497F5|nr:ninein-like protein [Gadus chalcogrammus]
MEHVAQLREVFDSCDATATGRLDRAELTELCTKLHLEPHLHLLLETLLGGRPYARVSFDEFKDGLVAILSRSVDLSTSEDESSYLEPARPEEVQPKFVNGAQRYGRRTHPDPPPGGGPAGPAQNSPPASPTDARRPKLPRSTSLESVESLKSEEDGVQEGGEGGGALEKEAESQMCDDLETSQHNTLELLSESADHLSGEGDHAPITSTPRWHPKHKAVRPAPPAVLCVSAGQRVLSCLDDGSGSTGPERVVALWTQEGVPNGQDILQVLDFPPEERVSLCDLSEALEHEMLSSRNSVHQAALVSYRLEIQHLQLQLEQVSRERDKVRSDFQAADRRNLQLVREGDDGHAAMETLNHSRIRDLEQEFRDRLTTLRSQSKQESEALQQLVEADRVEFRKEVELLKTQKSRLQEELDTTTQMSGALKVELCEVEESFQEAEQRGARLRRELDLLLGDQLASLDSPTAGRTLDDGVTIRNLQTHCRELQDRNDELSSELLKCQKSCRKSRRSTDDPLWTRPHSLITESDSDEFETYRGVSPLVKRKRDQPGDSVPCEDPAVSIQTELAMEQLRDKHSQELHSLRVELETKVNFYERSLELMRNSMEVERKDISQSFKLEISELEEERSRAEREVLELKEKIEQQKGGAWSSEQERRAQRELSERDQNYTRAINHLVQELSAEKKELEAELKLKMDQEVMLVRRQVEEGQAELSCLEERNSSLQQDVLRLEETLQNKTRRLEEVEREHERRREEEERLHKENVRSREEVLALSGRNLQLSGENAELSSRLRGDQEALRLLRERLEKVTKEHQEGAAKVRELEEKEVQKERERLQLLSSWKHERELLERELTSAKEKAERAEVLEEDLVSLRLKQQWVEQDKTRLLEETEHRTTQLEALQAEVCSVDGEVELLRSQLQSVTLERNGQAEEVASQHRKLQDVQQKMEELQEVQRINEEHQELTISAMQEEIRTLRHHNQDLLQRVSLVQNQEEEVQRLNQDCQTLRSRHTQLESARTMAEDQAVRSDTSRAVLQAKVSQQLQEVRQEVEGSSRQQLHLLQVRLEEQIRRSQGLEEELRTQALQASSQLHMHQEQQQQQLAEVQERLQQTETKVKSLRLLLQDKSQQLTEQVGSSLQSSQLLQSLYLENSQLVKALQVTESRQKNAEKRSGVLEDKVSALNSLIRDMVRMSLAT